MLTAILLIVCGLILVSVYFPGSFVKDMGKFLDPAGGVLGIIALVLGVIGLLANFVDLGAWTMTLSGVILGSRLVPAMKDMAKFLNPAGGIVGIAAIVFGVMGLLG